MSEHSLNLANDESVDKTKQQTPNAVLLLAKEWGRILGSYLAEQERKAGLSNEQNKSRAKRPRQNGN